MKQAYKSFLPTIVVLITLLLYAYIEWVLHARGWAIATALCGIATGSAGLFREIISSLLKKNFALDYIAVCAIVLGVGTGQFAVALIIALMLSTGEGLETYGMSRAKESLTALTDRIPDTAIVVTANETTEQRRIDDVDIGERILVRKGEVVPLDGTLLSDTAIMDESSLTGEPYEFEKVAGDAIRSGTVNLGNVLTLRVVKKNENSTYRSIINLVKQAQTEKAPLVRLADRYSTIFTLLTAIIAAAAFWFTRDIHAILAVLVVATPCPLILATPIALFGGMNAAAKHRIMIKKLSSLETMARVTDVVFDKTGTITLGQPQVYQVQVLDKQFDRKHILSIAEALERNSLHPIAKAVVTAAKRARVPRLPVHDVQEHIGHGISARIEDRVYTLTKTNNDSVGNSIELLVDDTPIARIKFEDTIKDNSTSIMEQLKSLGLHLAIFTGDKEENAKKLLQHMGPIGNLIDLKSNCSPEDKKNGIEQMREAGKITAMVGDGINDAPALASADVGLVFSNEEQTASSEAADIIFLGGDLSDVARTIDIAKRTIAIALQSIWVGIGLSVVAMIAAALGYIPPIVGAFLQEAIDVLVILNALRASRLANKIPR